MAQTQVGFYGGQLLFYFFGIVAALVGNYSRRLCIVLGVMDYDTNVHGGAAFEVPLLETDVWRVKDCVDTIRVLQHEFVLRHQRGMSRYEDPAEEEWEDYEGALTTVSAMSQVDDEEYHSVDEDEHLEVPAGGGEGP